MAVGKEIKVKIKTVDNTQKVTSAMQMVAASKMRRTQDRMREGRPYSEKVRQVIGHLANSNPEYKHIYMQEREVKRVGYIVISSDKGQCGGLNSNLFRVLVKEMQAWKEKGVDAQLGLIGNKAASFFRSVGGDVRSVLAPVGENPVVSELIGGLDADATG